MFKQTLLTVLVIAGTFGVAPFSFAGSQAGSVAASATLSSNCTVSATPLAFGAQSGIGNAATTQAALSVACTNSTAYTIGMDNGVHSQINQSHLRYLLGNGGASAINYKIARDSGLTQNWGNTPGTDTYAGVGSGDVQSIPVYGTIPQLHGNAVASDYSDTITVSVNY